MELRLYEVGCPIFLRACYAMSGTNMAYGPICLRTYYVMPGTSAAHGAICLHTSAVRCPVQTWPMMLSVSTKVLRDPRY
eukprot:1788805-Rhodomonas_salina.2